MQLTYINNSTIWTKILAVSHQLCHLVSGQLEILHLDSEEVLGAALSLVSWAKLLRVY